MPTYLPDRLMVSVFWQASFFGLFTCMYATTIHLIIIIRRIIIMLCYSAFCVMLLLGAILYLTITSSSWLICISLMLPLNIHCVLFLGSTGMLLILMCTWNVLYRCIKVRDCICMTLGVSQTLCGFNQDWHSKLGLSSRLVCGEEKWQ